MPRSSPDAVLTSDEALRQLAESTEQLRRAALAGDLPTAARILERRSVLAGALTLATAEFPVAAEGRRRLETVIGQGQEIRKILTGRRETLRAELAALEAGRRQLDAWTPAAESSASGPGWSA